MSSCNHNHDDSNNHSHSGCNHEHSHGFGHVHVAQNKLKIGIILTSIILLAEVIGGVLSNSLALLSDAGHMFTDVIALVIALLATNAMKKKPNSRYTYGYHRITVIAALINALSLIGIVFFIVIEAYHRFLNPEEIHTSTLLIVATVGLITNLIIMFTMSDMTDNVNIKSAYLHVLGDALASVGVIIGGIVIYFTDWYFIDAILSVVISLIIGFGAIKILKDIFVILMEGKPKDIDTEDIQKSLLDMSEVLSIHDLHVWTLTSSNYAMSVHIVVDGNMRVNEIQPLLENIETILEKKYKINHSTIQVETSEHKHKNHLYCINRFESKEE